MVYNPAPQTLPDGQQGGGRSGRSPGLAPMSGTSARHTYDHYQAKWDKWDNDEFVEQQLAEAERDDVRSTPRRPCRSARAPLVSVRDWGSPPGGGRAGRALARGEPRGSQWPIVR